MFWICVQLCCDLCFSIIKMPLTFAVSFALHNVRKHCHPPSQKQYCLLPHKQVPCSKVKQEARRGQREN